MACWVLVVLVFVLLKLSAEICSGSLASGCFFSKQLLFPKEKIVAFSMPKPMIWEARCLHFSTLEDHFGTSRAPWETVGAAGRTIGSAKFPFLVGGKQHS